MIKQVLSRLLSRSRETWSSVDVAEKTPTRIEIDRNENLPAQKMQEEYPSQPDTEVGACDPEPSASP